MSNVSLINGHIDKTTNYDRIRSMSIDEMAEALEKTVHCKFQIACKICCNDNCKVENKRECISKIKQWLESEVETE